MAGEKRRLPGGLGERVALGLMSLFFGAMFGFSELEIILSPMPDLGLMFTAVLVVTEVLLVAATLVAALLIIWSVAADSDQVETVGAGRFLDVVGRLPLISTAMLEACLAAGRFNENAPHRFGGRGKEVAARVPLLSLLDIDEANVGVMHQRCRLQGLPWLFVG